MGKFGEQAAVDAAKDFQNSEKGGADSSSQFAAAAHQARNDYQDSGSPFGELKGRDRSSKSDVPSKNSSSSSNDSGGSRVICTFFFQEGLLSKEVWRADLEFTQKYISNKTIIGYHYWAIPYVNLMKKSKFAQRAIFPFAKWRAEEIAYQMGVLQTPNLKGKLVRLFGEPICWLIGNFATQRDWRVVSDV